MTEPCALCGAAVPLVEHEFYEGHCLLSRPPGYKLPRKWSYWAGLYHNPVTKQSYCSPDCATKALAP